MKIVFFTIVIIIIITFTFAMDNEFRMHEICSDYDEGMEIFSIDFDNDGDFDLLTAGTDCKLWINDGIGNFTASDILNNTAMSRSIRAADLDADGDYDVVIAVLAGNQVIIMENIGTGFNQILLDNSLIFPHTLDLKDLDSDGDIDILCSEFNTSTTLSKVVWWQNQGNMNFSEKIIISEIFQQSTYVFAGFIDSDAHMDVVACGELMDDVMWWQNDGNQNFGDGFIIDSNFNRVHTIVGNDLDQDGDVDILGAACIGGLLAWWENDGEGNFTRNDIDVLGGALWMDCADFDNDGDNDLFAVGQDPSNAYIYENDGNEVFEIYPLSGIFNDGFSATACDLDNDGDIDLAAIGRNSGQICWWENKLYGVDFRAEQLSGNNPLEVIFTDQSSFIEPITMWMWDFENDGNFDSFEQNPSWIYEETGTYSVLLTVMVDGEPISYLKEDFINVFSGYTALEFTGDECIVECSVENSPNLTNAFTIEAWIKPYNYGPDANFGLGSIFDKSAISIFLSKSYPLYQDSSLVIEIMHADGSTSISTTSTNSISLNQWRHIAVSYDGIDDVKMYIDGIEMMTHQPNIPTGEIEDNPYEPILIGNLSNFLKDFTGIIDEVRIWNIARSEEEIQDNMYKYLHGYEVALLNYWKMDEANGEFIFDATSSDNNGMITNASWCEGMELEPTFLQESNYVPTDKINLQNYPNPFNPTTTIQFSLNTEYKENIKLEIYNLRGQKIEQLTMRNLSLGINEIIWDGTDENNQPVSSGIYFCRLKVGDQQISKKLILLK